MRSRLAFLLGFMLALVLSTAAQTKVVTNTDLEQYKKDRLKAAQEYRENYARLGFPSPEELDRRREQSRLETERLAAKFREEALEQERIETERRAAGRFAAAYDPYAQNGFEPEYGGSFYSFSYGRRHRFPVRQHYSQPGYFAGGQFWPTGPATRPQPAFGRPRR